MSTPLPSDSAAPIESSLPRSGFIMALASALLFAGWTLLVFRTDVVSPFDVAWAEHFHAYTQRDESLMSAMIFFTDLGGVACMTLLPILGAIWQHGIGKGRLALAWIIVVAGGGALNVVSKNLANRARPGEELRAAVVHERNYSYPSGHAMGSAIGYGMLGYALVRTQSRRGVQVATTLLLIGVVGTIGFSRTYLRAHWFSDVIGGWLIGLAWLSLCLGWIERQRLRAKEPRME